MDKDELGLLFNLYIKLYIHIFNKFNFNYPGRSTWKLLHTIAATYSDSPSEEQQKNLQHFITLLPKVYPCQICANDFAEM